MEVVLNVAVGPHGDETDLVRLAWPAFLPPGPVQRFHKLADHALHVLESRVVERCSRGVALADKLPRRKERFTDLRRRALDCRENQFVFVGPLSGGL